MNDVQQNLRGPEPVLLDLSGKLMVQGPYNVLNVGDGDTQNAYVHTSQTTPGGSGTGTSLPDNGQMTQGSSPQQPVSSTIDMQISKVVQKYHILDPLLRLIGPTNEAIIIVEGQRFLVLINSRAQLSTMSESLVQALRLPIHKLNTLIEAEASRGGIVQYVGYVEARLTIPGIAKMNEDSLFMVSSDSPDTKRVQLQIETLHIQEALQLATKEEIEALLQAWETTVFPSSTLIKSAIMKEPEFNLDKVEGHVKLTKSITIEPFQMVHASGLTECRQHFKRVNVIVEPDPHKDYNVAVPIHGYTVLKPRS